MLKTAFSTALLCLLGLLLVVHAKAAPLESSPLLQEAKRQLALVHTSTYQHRTDVDEATGRFNYDCSGFLDYALRRIAPSAYAELPVTKKPHSNRPLAQDFHKLFSQMTEPSSHWASIRKVNHIRAGDIVAWLRPLDNDSHNSPLNNDSHNTGHVMVVRAAPHLNPNQADEMLVSVIDSTSLTHAQDTRSKGQTGLGSGIIGIIIDSEGEPIAYHLKGGVSKRKETTKIAFGRLL